MAVEVFCFYRPEGAVLMIIFEAILPLIQSILEVMFSSLEIWELLADIIHVVYCGNDRKGR